MKKIFTVVICIVMIVFSLTNVYAFGSDPVVSNPGYDPSKVDDKIKKEVGTVWATIAVLVQIASVACVVFAGLRYMFASADQKADIKQGLIYLSIGAILVFGAITIIQFVVNATNEIL